MTWAKQIGKGFPLLSKEASPKEQIWQRALNSIYRNTAKSNLIETFVLHLGIAVKDKLSDTSNLNCFRALKYSMWELRHTDVRANRLC